METRGIKPNSTHLLHPCTGLCDGCVTVGRAATTWPGTIIRLDLSPSLRRCLGTTNIIENPHSGVRMRTRRVSRWRNGKRVLRWAASAFLATEKNFRRIQGYRDLWMLKAALESCTNDDRNEAA